MSSGAAASSAMSRRKLFEPGTGDRLVVDPWSWASTRRRFHLDLTATAIDCYFDVTRARTLGSLDAVPDAKPSAYRPIEKLVFAGNSPCFGRSRRSGRLNTDLLAPR